MPNPALSLPRVPRPPKSAAWAMLLLAATLVLGAGRAEALAFILGGSVGLYVTLGIRNPSNAILLASLLLPFATFHAITSFLLGHSMSAFLVTAVPYGFTTAAMMIPAIGEFDIAMGRTKSATDE